MTLVYSGASANGERSQTINEAALLIQSDPDESDDGEIAADTPSSNSTATPIVTPSSSRKRTRPNIGSSMVEAVNLMAKSLAAPPTIPSQPTITHSSMEKAIQLLEEEYTDVFSVDDFVTAAMVFENESKAKIFLTFKNRTNRIAWLKKQIDLANVN